MLHPISNRESIKHLVFADINNAPGVSGNNQKQKHQSNQWPLVLSVASYEQSILNVF